MKQFVAYVCERKHISPQFYHQFAALEFA